MAYKATIELASGVKPKNNGGFPLVQAKDVYVDDDTRLDEKLEDMDAAAVTIDSTLTQQGKAADAKAVGDAISDITIEVDATLTKQGKAADAKAVGDEVGRLKIALKSGSEADAIYHLGFYLDENGDLCQVEEETNNG